VPVQSKENDVSEKTSDENKLIARMRTNTEKQGRRTGAKPYRRTRMKVMKNRPKDGPEKATTLPI
jgi:hypothetical protein